MVHVGLIIALLLSFIALMIFGTSNANAGESISRRQKREIVQERRDRIMRNGNIQNTYPKKFRIEWFLVNNKAYMGIIFNNGVNRQWQAR